MAKCDDIPKTDPSEIKALIQRLKQSNLEPRDTQLVERLLRIVLSMATLLQEKNASIKRLKRLIFGPSSDKRAVTGSSTEVEAAPGKDSEQQPGSDSSPVTTKSSLSDQKPKRSGHGRMAASAYTGAKVVICRIPSAKWRRASIKMCRFDFAEGTQSTDNFAFLVLRLTWTSGACAE